MEEKEPSAAVYGLKFQSRCLAPVPTDSENHRFFVGTCNLRASNEIHIVSFDEDTHSAYCEKIFDHPNEIWKISPSLSREDVFATVHNSVEKKFQVSIWRMNENENGEDILTELHLLEHNGDPQDAVWDPIRSDDTLASIDGINLYIWNIAESAKLSSKQNFLKQRVLCSLDWNPIHSDQLILGSEGSAFGWDIRSSKFSYVLEKAHNQLVRQVQHNPNKPYVVATGGDDGIVKIWDVRNSSIPLLTLSGHSHWITSIRYNHLHDQLILTSSTDSLVNLWRGITASSDAKRDEIDEAEIIERHVSQRYSSNDTLCRSIDEHEDSVYCVAWSVCSPWVFASLSYDGRLLFHSIPKEEKYRILL